MTDFSKSSQIEEARIHEAYRKRQGTTLYSWFSPGHLFLIQGREREILGLLRKKGIESLDEKKNPGSGLWNRLLDPPVH